jgi:endoglucanase
MFLLFCVDSHAQDASTEKVRLNQLGFYPQSKKIALVLTEKPLPFSVVDAESGKSVFTGTGATPVKSIHSGKHYSRIDFSSLTKPGRYAIMIDGIGRSHSFSIGSDVYLELAKGAIKNYYFQRMSIPLDQKHAGKWHRPEGHPDQQVYIHASAVSASRPAETVFASPKGWYDAGDYNKYIVNSGITMGTMLSAWEEYASFYATLDLNIPESSNQIPDLLDELLWNLRWMLTMQDPQDGGVYHKLTNPNFDGMVMPHQATGKRYVVMKSTAAALDFAAVTAQASRVFRSFLKELPGLSDSCLLASRRAWEWAMKNPSVLYEQQKMNKSFDPDVTTGTYGDNDVRDEFFWAACELYATTADKSFLGHINQFKETAPNIPSWGKVNMLGYFSVARLSSKVNLDNTIVEESKSIIVSMADALIADVDKNALQAPMGKTAKDFPWGSSAVAANQAFVLTEAYHLTGNELYLDNALSNMDHLLGRNGTGYSFVTGFGSKTPMHPHHRPSEADGVAEPIPGMLSGGPNPSRQDKCNYTSTSPDEAFVDDVCSYASNEIAINWNAPLVYIAGAVEALKERAGYVTKDSK